MAEIKITGIRPYDGAYDLQEERPFNTHEWHVIKRVSGYMPLTIQEGWAGGDPSLVVALAVVAMCRSGKITRDRALAVADQLGEAPFDGAAITVDFGVEEDEPEADASPPDVASEPKGSSLNGSLEKPNTSGPASKTSSDPSETTPQATGALR